MERLIRFFASNSLLVNLIVIFIILAGLLNIQSIKREMYPSVDIDMMVIYAIYPGASSHDVEMNAVIPIEKELRKISGIRYFTSYSIENMGKITLFLDYDIQNKRAVKDEVFRNIRRSNLSGISSDVESIKVFDLNPKLMGIMHLAVFPKEDNVNEFELNTQAEKIEEMLRKINGVSSVRKLGFREREVQINTDLQKMDSHYVSLNNIVDAIKARNVRATGGTLQSLLNKQTIVTIGEFEDPLDVKNVIIRSNMEGKKISIKDIAKVRYGFKHNSILTRVNGKRSIVLEIVKKENADIISTADLVRKFVNKKPLKGTKYNISIINDLSVSINAMLNAILANTAAGFFLVVVVLLIFLNFRTAFWIAFAIPVSLMITIVVMNLNGISMNLVSIAAIITILGMLVDDGIVVGESIYTESEKEYEPVEAALIGIKRIFMPVIVSITTTIIAFLPMFSIKGLMGKVIYIFPIVISVALLASLFEAFFLLPNHIIHAANKNKKEPQENEKKWFSILENYYTKMLFFSIRKRYLFVLLIIFFSIGMIAISSEAIKNFILFWDDSSDKVFINLEASDGISQEYMDEVSLKVEKSIIEQIPPEERVSSRIILGTHNVRPGDMKGTHENWSQIIITLVPITKRDRTADQIISDLRKKIKAQDYPPIRKVLFEKMSLGPPTGEPVNIKIIAKDLTIASDIQKKIEEYLESLPGVFDIANDQKEGKNELKISFYYDRLAQLNLNVAAVAQTIRTAYEGTVATSMQTIDDTLDFRVQVDEKYKRDKKFIENLVIPNYFGRLIRLGETARIEKQTGKSVINHYNGDRVITVTANVDQEKITSSQVASDVLNHFAGLLSRHPEVTVTIGGEAKETSETMGGLVSAFLLAVILIYFILTLLFHSFSQPLLIMMTVPFSITGAVLAFYVHGIPLTFMGIIGIIGLIGVVVNDNIVMIDFINKEVRSSEKNIIENIVYGAKQRLRAIILTTLTTVLGLLPTVYGIGGTSNAIVPTVMAMAYGLLFATVLTLIFVPLLYVIYLDIQKILYMVNPLRKPEHLR